MLASIIGIRNLGIGRGYIGDCNGLVVCCAGGHILRAAQPPGGAITGAAVCGR